MFPPKRLARYDISIAAGPDDPAVEHDLHRFIDVIETELQACAGLLCSCSERWRGFILPGGIDRRGIKSIGYRYGEYQFTLDQRQVLDLLMGENLYQDPYVFVRELLQNAIDTCRHREYVEHQRGNPEFHVTPITVSEWDDAEGYHWVRFDDFGMGMNEQIVRDYLLKVGSCYYASAQFRADLLRAQKRGAPEFCPVSRFGIGLLSCFLAGDRVEISTVHQGEHGIRDTPVRLSLSGLHGFYTLQTPPLPFNPMPGAKGAKDDGHLREVGTSVAVRLDPRKEQGVFNLRAQLERYLLCPPVPVELDGERIGGDSATLLDKPFAKRKRVKLSKKEMSEFSKGVGYDFQEPLYVEFIPLNITAHSPSRELKGQLVLTHFVPSKEWERLASASEDLRLRGLVEFGVSDAPLQLSLHASVPFGAKPEDCKDTDARRIMEHIKYQGSISHDGDIYQLSWIELNRYAACLLPRFSQIAGENPRWLVHNGLTMPVRLAHLPDKDWRSWDERILWFKPRFSASWATLGMIYLSDSFRPDVSVARDLLHNLPTQVQSAIELAGLRAKKAEGIGERSALLNHSITNEAVLLGTILNDDLITSPTGWRIERIIQTGDDDYSSLNEVTALIAAGKASRLIMPSPASLMQDEWGSLFDCYAATLAQLELCVELRRLKRRKQWSWELMAVPGKSRPVRDAHKLFPPLTFVPFAWKRVVLMRDGRLNSKHPFSQWLLDKAPAIHQRYPGILRSLREAILTIDKYVMDRYSPAIEQNLVRLTKLHSDVRPPASVYRST